MDVCDFTAGAKVSKKKELRIKHRDRYNWD
jgi:hypothetical protein